MSGEFPPGAEPGFGDHGQQPLPPVERLTAALAYEPDERVAETWYGGNHWYVGDVRDAASRFSPTSPLPSLEGTSLELARDERPVIDEALRGTMDEETGRALARQLWGAEDAMPVGRVYAALEGVTASTLLGIAQLPRQVARRDFLAARRIAGDDAFGPDWERRLAAGELEGVASEAVTAFEERLPATYQQRLPDFVRMPPRQQQAVAELVAQEAVELCGIIARHMPDAFTEHPDWFDLSRTTDLPPPLLFQAVSQLRSAITYHPGLSPRDLITAYMNGSPTLRSFVEREQVQDRRLTGARAMQQRSHEERLADPDIRPALLTAEAGAVIQVTDPAEPVTPSRFREIVGKHIELAGSHFLLRSLERPDASDLDLPYLAAGWQKSLETAADRVLKVGKQTFNGSILNLRFAALGATDEWIAENIREPQEVSRDQVLRFAILANLKSGGRPAVAQGIEVVIFTRRDPQGAGRYVVAHRASGKVHNQAALEGLMEESRRIGEAIAANAMLRPITIASGGLSRRGRGHQ